MFQHDEKTGKELLDENGRRLFRTEFCLDGINCEALTFDLECKQLNCPFVLYVGTKKLVKRKEFEEYIRTQVAI